MKCDRNAARNVGQSEVGKFPFFPPDKIKSEEEKERELIPAKAETGFFPTSDCLPELAAYLAANPALTPRDYKGKGFGPFAPFDPHHVSEAEKPWRDRDKREVRALAITYPARFLSKGARQAAARDPGLSWDEASRRYRLTGEFDA